MKKIYKYKLYQFKDDNDKTWFQVKDCNGIFNKWLRYLEFGCTDCGCPIKEFLTRDHAISEINLDVKIRRTDNIRIISIEEIIRP